MVIGANSLNSIMISSSSIGLIEDKFIRKGLTLYFEFPFIWEKEEITSSEVEIKLVLNFYKLKNYLRTMCCTISPSSLQSSFFLTFT